MTDDPTAIPPTPPQQEPPTSTGPTRTRVRAEAVNHLQRALAYLREGDELGPESIGSQEAISTIYALRAVGHGLITLGGELRLANQIAYLTALAALGTKTPESIAKIEALEHVVDTALGLDR